jgi:phage terminase small subunit
MGRPEGTTALTVKQTRFCEAFIELGGATAAYRVAFNTQKMKAETIHQRAYELLRRSKIGAMVEKLREEHAKKHEITVDSLCAELDEMLAIARAEKQASAGIAAILGKAKICGLLVEKVESKVQSFVVETPAVCETTSQWLRECAEPELARTSSKRAGQLLEFTKKAE